MVGNISRVYKKIPQSALGIFKVNEYPFEQRDFKPFALARLCILDDEFLVARMWSFEVEPKGSCLALAVGGNSSFLVFTANEKGVVTAQNCDKTALDETFHTHFFTGEDLQGIYWGCEIKIPLSLLEEKTGFKLADRKIHLNVYKTASSGKEHFGGVVTPQKPDLFCPDSLGEFEITLY